MRFYYQLTTLDPIIVSQSNATTNNHDCLDYIPGSAILGMLAGKHYSKLTEQESWQTFHSGDVQFSPCYPLIEQEVALPTPSCWHVEKGEEALKGESSNIQQYNQKKITNHAAASFNRDEQIQYKQCRMGYLTSKAKTQKIEQGYRTKTAIERSSGSAEKSQLFSYSYIEAEQSFIGWININEKVNKNLILEIKNSLHGIVRIGRSRNTEFGRVLLSPITVKQTNTDVASELLIIWCLSDVEIINQYGMPTLTPTGADIHPKLTGIPLDANKSFVLSNNVSRFNQKRQGLDTEQVLISKGSILTFDLSKPEHKAKVTTQLLNSINNQGIGLNKQQGLGWVCINPAWSNQESINAESQIFTPLKVELLSKATTQINEINESSLLTKWLAEKVKQKTETIGQQAQVNNLLFTIIDLYKNARSYNNIIPTNEAGPSLNQWRRIDDRVRSFNDLNKTEKEEWNTPVFEGKHAICKADSDEFGWGINLQGENGQTTFADEIKQLLKGQSIHTMRLLMEQLCCFDLSTFGGLNDIKPTPTNSTGSQ